MIVYAIGIEERGSVTIISSYYHAFRTDNKPSSASLLAYSITVEDNVHCTMCIVQ